MGWVSVRKPLLQMNLLVVLNGVAIFVLAPLQSQILTKTP
jgi:hypothetical protein